MPAEQHTTRRPAQAIGRCRKCSGHSACRCCGEWRQRRCTLLRRWARHWPQFGVVRGRVWDFQHGVPTLTAWTHTTGQSRATVFQTRRHLPPHSLVRPFSLGPLRPAGFGGRFGGLDAQCADVIRGPALRSGGVTSLEQGFELRGVLRLELARQNQPELPATQRSIETHPF